MKKAVSGQRFAKKLGVSSQLVNRKRRQGKSDEQIMAEAKKSKAKTSPPPEKVNESFADAQRRKESALADLREQELAEKRGELISTTEQVRLWARVAQSIRDELMSIGERKSQEWAAITDPRQIREQVDAEMRRLCTKTIPDEIRTISKAA